MRNLAFCSAFELLTVYLTPFVNKPDSSRDLTIFMISFIYSFEISNAVIEKASDKTSEGFFLLICCF